MAGDTVIELKGLTKNFRGHFSIGRHTAVDGLDLEVRRGEIFGLLGPNGAGKTTTIKTLIGLLRPDQGTVRLMGRDPSDPQARARIGFLPENPYFYEYLTAEEFLDFYGRLQGLTAGERRERVAGTLERVGLKDRGHVALGKFSKGMTQRLGLAQAILHDPDLLILDEPMSGLDPVGRREVRDLILELKGAGRSVFFSSHILQDAEMICDRIAILVGGKLRFTGTLDRVASRKTLWLEVALAGAVPASWESEAVAVQGGQTLIKVPDIEGLTRLLNDARSAGAQVVSVWPRRETLEDLFLREVGAVREERASAGEETS